MNTINIIGVDCAAQAKNTGLVWASSDTETLVVREARCASIKESAASIVARWMKDSHRVLLALDAPLGWPAELGRELARHRAGEPLKPAAHVMFRRVTDDEIYKRFRKRPLEVAADRIARAAHAALKFLCDLRERVGDNIPLIWSPDWTDRYGVIEVYPAATRIALGVQRGSGSLTGFEARLRFEEGSEPASEHARDAVVCAITAVEFLARRTVGPTKEQRTQAVQEGWIWAGPSHPGHDATHAPNNRAVRRTRSASQGLRTSAHRKSPDPKADAIQARRERFRPERISTLFIAESPPDAGTFFYDGNSLLHNQMKAVFAETLGSASEFLGEFKRRGFFLDDLVHTPINRLTASQRQQRRLDAIPGLVERLRAYQPRSIVTLMRGIEPMVTNALAQVGLAHLPRWGVPFPRPEHQAQFKQLMMDIISRLPNARRR